MIKAKEDRGRHSQWGLCLDVRKGKRQVQLSFFPCCLSKSGTEEIEVIGGTQDRA